MGDPISSIAETTGKAIDAGNNLVNKISSAIGWKAMRKGSMQDAIDTYVDGINADDKIPLLVKSALISKARITVKEYVNQCDILEQAKKYLGPNDRSQEMNNDWIAFFFDKSKIISEDEAQKLWGKILASESTEPNSISKSLIQTLSVIDKSEAQIFKVIGNHVFNKGIPLIYFNEMNHYFAPLGITLNSLLSLDKLNLIHFEPVSNRIVYIKNLILSYDNKRISVTSNTDNFNTGNVDFTKEGRQLFKLVECEFQENYLQQCIDFWIKLGYTVDWIL